METLRALIDGALGVGAFEASVRRYGFIDGSGDPVTAQAVANAQNGGLAPVNPGLSQNTAPAPAGDQGPQQFCTHGPKKWVGPGVSKKTGKPYNGFWACNAPQGEQKCR